MQGYVAYKVLKHTIYEVRVHGMDYSVELMNVLITRGYPLSYFDILSKIGAKSLNDLSTLIDEYDNKQTIKNIPKGQLLIIKHTLKNKMKINIPQNASPIFESIQESIKKYYTKYLNLRQNTLSSLVSII